MKTVCAVAVICWVLTACTVEAQNNQGPTPKGPPRPAQQPVGVCQRHKWRPLTTLPPSTDGLDAITIGRGMQAGLVVTHCASSLSWLWPEVEQLYGTYGIRVTEVQIYSKCGVDPLNDPPKLSWDPTIKVGTLPNVGRCDHTYAYHLGNHSASDLQPLTIFVKDTYKDNQLPLIKFVPMAIHNGLGFSCAHRAVGIISSDWHLARKLSRFQLQEYVSNNSPGDNSNFRVPGQRGLINWLKSLGLNQPDLEAALLPLEGGLVPVCYRGAFAALRENIRHISQLGWRKFASALERSDNLEEGHHMERIWSMLISNRLPWDGWRKDEKDLQQAPPLVKQPENTPGRLFRCRHYVYLPEGNQTA